MRCDRVLTLLDGGEGTTIGLHGPRLAALFNNPSSYRIAQIADHHEASFRTDHQRVGVTITLSVATRLASVRTSMISRRKVGGSGEFS